MPRSQGRPYLRGRPLLAQVGGLVKRRPRVSLESRRLLQAPSQAQAKAKPCKVGALEEIALVGDVVRFCARVL